MVIGGTTQLLGVLGYPIEHSRSPAMHNRALAAADLDYIYLPLLVAPEQLGVALAGLTALNWVGASVTIPHKQAIIPYLESITPSAQAIGAVNTIWRTPTGWQGTNTDIIGFLHPLQQLGSDWSATTMVVLGGGGAARAVVAAGQELGCAQIVVVGRDRAKLAQFQASWAQPPAVAQWEELDGHLARAGLVVNCTPIGMTPNPEASPLSGAQISLLPPGAVVYDLIYSPRPTLLLQMAAQRGLGAIDGVEMLVYQGAAAWEYWLGRPAPAALMQQALLESLASK